MKHLLVNFSIIILFSYAALGQSEVEFEIKKEPNKLIWVCKNNGNFTKEVTFTLKEPKGLRGYSKPVTKIISPNAEMIFLTVSYNGGYSYKGASWISKDKATKEEEEALDELKSKYYTNDFANLDKGIYVFDKKGCPRCKRSVAYLIDNDYDFKIIKTDKGTPGNHRMWELLRAKGYTKKIFNMPVFLVNGQLTADHDDLMGFLKTLSKPKN